MATQLHGNALGVSVLQQVQRKRLWTMLGNGPDELLMHGLLKGGLERQVGVSQEHVDPGQEAVDSMNEKGQVDGRIPRERIPRHGPLCDRSIRVRHDTLQHREKLLCGNRRCSVERHRTPPLMNDLVRGDHAWPGIGRGRLFRSALFRERGGFVGDAHRDVPSSLFHRGFP